MYATLLLICISVLGYFAKGSSFALWMFCTSIGSCAIWVMFRFKSTSDYADLLAQRLRLLVLLGEMRAGGYDSAANNYLSGVTSNWLIIRTYVRKVHIYSLARKNLFLRQWIAPVPPELEITLITFENLILEGPSWLKDVLYIEGE